MAEVLLFHHVLGRTSGMEALAERFRSAGHTVHLPDLFDGRVLADRVDGRAYADEIGLDAIIERGRLAAETLPQELVYAGISLGALPAQLLTQTRAGARGALFVSATIEPGEFGAGWPKGVTAQIHLMEDDPLVAEGDLDVARDMVGTVPGARLYLYPGSTHLFTEAGHPDHDPAATDVFVERSTDYLADL